MTSPDSPAVVYVSLGSNIDPLQNLKRTVRMLRVRCDVQAVSPVYRTPPQGDPHQPDFLNMAVRLTTSLSPAEFKTQILADIEQRLGRVRDPHNKNAPRTIDLDISLWNEAVLDYGDKPWHAPDRDVLRFAHVAVPLADIAPDYIHPETGQTLAQIAAQFDLSALHHETFDPDDEVFYIVNVEGAIWHDGRYLMVVRGEEEEHAAGTLSLVGGKVEGFALSAKNILEDTLKREIWEEVGLEVDTLNYVESRMFSGDDGIPVVNIVFLCRYLSGTITISDPGEVAAALWLTPAEIRAHPRTPPWTQDYLNSIETLRMRLGW